MRAFGKRLLGFAVVPLISAVSPFLVLPVVARSAGVQGWAAIGVGQSVGALAAMVVIGGWSLHGPARAAPASGPERRALYGESLVGRGFLYVCVLPPVVLANLLLLPGEVAPVGALTSMAFALAGLSPSWFAIGVGRPALMARFEVVPRTAGALVAAGLVALTGQVAWYPAILFCGTLTGIVLLHAHEGFGGPGPLAAALRGLWRSRHDLFAVVAAGLYSTIPVTLVGAAVVVGDVARYSSADRVYRIGLLSIVALGGALQGWVAEDAAARHRRMRVSVLAHALLGLSGGAALVALGAPVTALLFGERVGAAPDVVLWYGVAFAAVSLNTSTGGHLLIPLGASRSVLTSTVIGAVVGVGAMLVLLPQVGAVGAAMGLALGEVVVCVVQVLALLRLRAPSVAQEPAVAPDALPSGASPP